MKQKVVSIGDINVANDLPFVLRQDERAGVARPAMRICEHYVTVTQKLGILTSSKPPLIKPTVPPSTPIVGRVWKKG